MENFEISSAQLRSVVSTEPPAAAPPKDEDVDLFNAALRGETTAPSYTDTAQADPQKEVLPQNQEDQIFQAAAQGAENLAKVVQQLVSENPSLAEAIAAYASKLNPASAATFAEAAIQANPQAAAQIAASVAEVAIPANPQAAAQIAGSVFAIAMNAISNISSPNTVDIAARIAEVAVKANPSAAPDIAAEMMRTALSFSLGYAPAVAEALQSVINEVAPDFSAVVGAVLQNIQTNTLPNGGSNIPATPAPVAVAPVAGVFAGTGLMPTGGTTPAPSAAPAPSQNMPSTPDEAPQSAFFAPQATPTTVGASIPVPQESPKVISQNLLQLIANTVSKMEIGETQTTIVLQKTDELPGEVSLEVRMRNGALEVVFKASDPKSLATLQNNFSALQSRLQQASGATSVQIFLAGQSLEEKFLNSDDSKSETGTDSKTERSTGRDEKDRIQGKSKSGGAQQ